MRSRRMLPVCLACIMVASMLCGMDTMPAEGADGSFGGGDGSAADPYVIEDVWDLQNMSADLGAHYVLGNDIDASATSGWNSGAGFVPVGTETAQFHGSLDGRNHTITGLYINRSTTDYVGLFGYISYCTLRNVGLVDVDVTGDDEVGGLVGYGDIASPGSVSECYSTGHVTGRRQVGGLMGFLYILSTTVTKIDSSGSVSGIENVGGLVGKVSNGRMSDCYATGNVDGTKNVGALVGSNGGKVSYCHATGSASGDSSVGALVGLNYGTVSDCHATGNATGTENVGGLVGLEASIYAVVSDSYATGSVLGTYHYVGGLVGLNVYGPVSGSHATGSVIGGEDVGGLIGRNEHGTVSTCHATGAVHGDRNVGGFAGDSGGKVSSCYASGNVSGGDAVGGFVAYNRGTASDCYSTGEAIGDDHVGGFAALNSGTSTNCHATGNVSGTRTHVGGLVGENGGTVASCFATGNVSGSEYYVGGLVGENDYVASIKHSYATGNVTGTSSFVGGLVGSIHSYSLVTNCSATGNVRGDDSVGGLAGNSNEGTVSNCSATGDVSGTASIGGLLGLNQGIVSNCSATGNVSGDRYVGGLVGANDNMLDLCHATGSVHGTVYVGGLVGSHSGHEASSCYATGNVTGTNYVGGLVGSCLLGSLRNSHYDIDKVLINGGHHVTRGGIFDDQYQDWMDNGMRLSISNYSSTLVYNYGGYEVMGIPGLRDLLGFTELWGYEFRLTANLDLSSSPGLYIPCLSSSVFDGNGHTISNLTLNQTFTPFLGFIAGLGGEVRDVGVRDFNIINSDYASGLVGYNRGTVSRCTKAGSADIVSACGGALVGYNDGTVSYCSATGGIHGDGSVGALVGFNDGTVSNCSATGDIIGGNCVGGLVGNNGGEVSDCTATVNASGIEAVGALMGANTGTVSDCRAAGDTEGARFVGGFVGDNDYGTISRCHASGVVHGTDSFTGGFAGTNEGTISRCDATANALGTDYVGGLIGRNSGRVSECFATGTVSGTGPYVGGLVGYHVWGTVSDCYATGNVNATGSEVGGLVGHSWSTVSYCYAAGNVSCPGSDVGGLVGLNGASVAYCFWDLDTSGQGSSAGGTGKATAAMRKRTTFTSAWWDFGGIWDIVEDKTYPFLRGRYSAPVLIATLPDAVEEEPYTASVTASLFPFPGYPDAYTFGISTDCTWLSLSPSGELSGTPSNDDVGTWQLTITVTDLLSNSDRRDYQLRVMDANDAPEVLATSLPDAMEDQAYSARVEARDIDRMGDVLTWALVGTDAGFLELDPMTGVLRGTPGNEDVGRWWVAVRVTDGRGGSATANLTLTVLNENDDPVIDTTELAAAVEDQPYSALVEGHDIDPTGNELSWSLDTDADFLTLDPRTGELSGTPSNTDVGEWSVDLSLSDGNGGLARRTLVLRVVNTNDDPVITTTVLPDAVEDLDYRFVVEATDPDLGDALMWRLVQTDAAFLFLDPLTGTLSGAPDNGDVGWWSVTLEASDGVGGLASVTLALRVLNVNDAPVITTASLDDAVEDVAYRFTCEALDIDPTADALAWSISTPATFLSIDSRTGMLSGTPTNDDVGEWSVNVSVSDGHGGFHWAHLDLTVVNVNDAPRILSVLPVNGSSYRQGRAVAFSVETVDDDGDELDVTWWEGNRQLGSGPALEYGKLKPGKHLVRVTVADGNATVEAATEVTVKAEDSPGPGMAIALLAIGVSCTAIRRRRG